MATKPPNPPQTRNRTRPGRTAATTAALAIAADAKDKLSTAPKDLMVAGLQADTADVNVEPNIQANVKSSKNKNKNKRKRTKGKNTQAAAHEAGGQDDSTMSDTSNVEPTGDSCEPDKGMTAKASTIEARMSSKLSQALLLDKHQGRMSSSVGMKQGDIHPTAQKLTPFGPGFVKASEAPNTQKPTGELITELIGKEYSNDNSPHAGKSLMPAQAAQTNVYWIRLTCGDVSMKYQGQLLRKPRVLGIIYPGVIAAWWNPWNSRWEFIPKGYVEEVPPSPLEHMMKPVNDDPLTRFAKVLVGWAAYDGQDQSNMGHQIALKMLMSHGGTLGNLTMSTSHHVAQGPQHPSEELMNVLLTGPGLGGMPGGDETQRALLEDVGLSNTPKAKAAAQQAERKYESTMRDSRSGTSDTGINILGLKRKSAEDSDEEPEEHGEQDDGVEQDDGGDQADVEEELGEDIEYMSDGSSWSERKKKQAKVDEFRVSKSVCPLHDSDTEAEEREDLLAMQQDTGMSMFVDQPDVPHPRHDKGKYKAVADSPLLDDYSSSGSESDSYEETIDPASKKKPRKFNAAEKTEITELARKARALAFKLECLMSRVLKAGNLVVSFGCAGSAWNLYQQVENFKQLKRVANTISMHQDIEINIIMTSISSNPVASQKSTVIAGTNVMKKVLESKRNSVVVRDLLDQYSVMHKGLKYGWIPEEKCLEWFQLGADNFKSNLAAASVGNDQATSSSNPEVLPTTTSNVQNHTQPAPVKTVMRVPVPTQDNKINRDHLRKSNADILNDKLKDEVKGLWPLHKQNDMCFTLIVMHLMVLNWPPEAPMPIEGSALLRGSGWSLEVLIIFRNALLGLNGRPKILISGWDEDEMQHPEFNTDDETDLDGDNFLNIPIIMSPAPNGDFDTCLTVRESKSYIEQWKVQAVNRHGGRTITLYSAKALKSKVTMNTTLKAIEKAEKARANTIAPSPPPQSTKSAAPSCAPVQAVAPPRASVQAGTGDRPQKRHCTDASARVTTPIPGHDGKDGPLDLDSTPRAPSRDSHPERPPPGHVVC
ncbi:hypothetical protein DXG01_001543 [Tephrocybe rancida]|nr:hypothetical protein DXG01_001543 [Tephrocybe rancida]